MSVWIRWGLRGLLLCGLAWIAGSYLGMVHPLGDSLAVFRIYAAIATGLIALLCWNWGLGKVAALVAGVIVMDRGLDARAAPLEQPAAFTVYQKNLLFHGRDRTTLIADIQAAAPDVITLQEVSTLNLPLLDALKTDYPHQHMCEGRNIGGVAILSRWPLEITPCSEAFGLGQAVAQTPAGDVSVIVVHLHWPFPFSQKQHVDLILRNMTTPPEGPVVLAGDFNMVPWGHSVRRLKRATGATQTGHTQPTWRMFGVSLMIDHVFAGSGAEEQAEVALDIRPRFGSDHYGVLARIAF